MTTGGVSTSAWRHRLDRWLGLDLSIFAALLKAFLLMDFRNQQFGSATATGPKAALSPLFWVVGQNLLIGGFVSGLLFARVDLYFFTVVNLSVAALLMIGELVVEFNEVVLAPSDLDVVGHHPAPVRTYAAARVANLLGYVLLIAFSTNLFPALVGMGLDDAGWWFLPVYGVVSLLASLLAAGLVILLFTLVLGRGPEEGLQQILAWTQIVVIAIAFYGGQLALRDANKGLEMLAYRPPEWLAWLPTAWWAWFIDQLAQGAAAPWWIVGVTALATWAAWSLVLMRLSTAYAAMQPGARAWQRTTLAPLPAPGELVGAIARRLTRPGEERTAWWLATTMFHRDHDLKMRTWPTLSVSAAALALGAFSGQLGDPLVDAGPHCVLSLAALYMLAVPLPAVLHNMSFSRDYAAAWLLAAAPVADRVAFAEGMRKAVTYTVLGPALAVVLVVFAICWQSPASVLLHAAAGWLVLLFGGYAGQMLVLRRAPFSGPAARGEAFGPIALATAAVGGAAGTLAGLHYLAMRGDWGWLVYLLLFAALVSGLRWLAHRTVRHAFALELPAYE